MGEQRVREIKCFIEGPQLENIEMIFNQGILQTRKEKCVFTER
jgi:hypothetical protein